MLPLGSARFQIANWAILFSGRMWFFFGHSSARAGHTFFSLAAKGRRTLWTVLRIWCFILFVDFGLSPPCTLPIVILFCLAASLLFYFALHFACVPAAIIVLIYRCVTPTGGHCSSPCTITPAEDPDKGERC